MSLGGFRLAAGFWVQPCTLYHAPGVVAAATAVCFTPTIADAAAAAASADATANARPGIPCERFAAGPGLPPCKVNTLTWCHTDLAANAYAWPRFIADDMRFGVLDSGHGASHDGVMADVVRSRGWKVRPKFFCRRLFGGQGMLLV